MARVSFTVRSTAGASGSYLRYDDAMGVRTNDDSKLRYDGFQFAPSVFDASFFQADSVCYGEVQLNWGVTILPIAAPPPVVTQSLLVYSTLGEPTTILSGEVLVENDSTLAYTHTGLPEGQWAYYSLFVHYASTGGDSYYERVASLSVLVPKNYGSTMALWNRIPAHYREQDMNMGTADFAPCIETPPGDVVGPLFKYLSIFGFDMDRMRTILDYVMTAHDPAVADTEALDALAIQMDILGTKATMLFNQTMTAADLGTARLRRVLNDIGFFYRAKGTPASVQFLARALTGSDVTLDTAAHTVTIYSQRVNYITAPANPVSLLTSRSAVDSEVTTPLPF